MSSSTGTQPQQLKEVMQARAGEEKSLGRKIVESSIYDWCPTARFLLSQIALLRMDEDSNYPNDAPEKCKADKVDWCWMSQHKLALRMGVSESTVHRWIKRFRKDGVILLPGLARRPRHPSRGVQNQRGGAGRLPAPQPRT